MDTDSELRNNVGATTENSAAKLEISSTVGEEWKLVCVQEKNGRRDMSVWGAAQKLEGVKQETGCQGGQMRCWRINTFEVKEMRRG